MTVGILATLLFLLLTPAVAQVNPHATCNIELLNSFKLSGMAHPSREKLEICINVENNCCTMADELTIVKYWRDYTSPKVYKFANLLASIYQRMFNFQRYITQVDFKNIMVHYTQRSWFSYQQEVCARIEGRRPTELFDTRREYQEWKKNIPQSHEELDSLYLLQNMSRRKLFVDSLKPEVLKTLKNAGRLQVKFEEAVGKAMKRLRDDLSNQNTVLRKLAQKMSNRFKKDVETSVDQKLQSFLEKAQAQLGKLSEGSEADQRAFVKEARSLLEENPTKLAEEARDVQNFVKLVRNHLQISRKAQQKAAKRAGAVSVRGRSKLAKQLRFVMRRRRRVPSIQEFYAPEFERPVEPFPAITDSLIDCQVHDRKAYRTFLQINRPKYEHCFKVHENMKIIDQMEFDDLIVGIRDAVVRVLDVKKTLYCAVCDADSHKYFDIDHGVIMMDEEFCRDLVGTYRDYIEFANIVMVQFGEQLLQYMGCINSLPQEISVPFLTRFEFHKRNIFFFKRCFDNLLGEDYMRYCHFLCSTFNFDNFSRLIDGDLQLMYAVYMEIVDFTRANNIPFDTSLIIDDDFLQGLNSDFYPRDPSKAYRGPEPPKVDPIRQRDIDAALEANYRGARNNFLVGKSDFKLSLSRNVTRTQKEPAANESEVFSRVKRVYSPRNMRYLYFPDGQGLNPLSLVSGSYIQLDLDNFVTDYYKKLNRDRSLSSSTIRSFFSVKGKDIVEFNSDLDLDYDPDLTHKPPERHALSIADIYRKNYRDVASVEAEREEIPAKLAF